jgi:hypothetical protein
MQTDAKSLPLKEFGFLVLILLAIQLAVALSNGTTADLFLDTDVYSWLNRVVLLHQNGEWFNARLPWVNPPDGHLQHWTRPFDVLLYAGAFVLSPVVGFERGLSIWGQWLSPILHVFSLFALVWAFSPSARKEHTDMLPVLALVFLVQLSISSIFAFGRADHQSLLCLLYIVALGLTIRMLSESLVRNRALLAGLVSGFAVWVSMESMLSVLIIQVSLGVFWVFGDTKQGRNLVYYTGALALTAAVSLLLQSGIKDYVLPLGDQISIVYVILFALMFLFWLGVSQIAPKASASNAWLLRLGFAGLGAVCIGVGVIALFPDMIGGPLSNVDEIYRKVRLENIAEIQPLINWTKLAEGEWALAASRFLPYLGIAIPAIAVIVYHLSRGVSAAGATREARFWAPPAIAALLFVPLTFYQIRWVYYASIVLIPAYAWFVVTAMNYVQQRFGGAIGSGLKIIVLVGLATGPNLGFLLRPHEASAEPEKTRAQNVIVKEVVRLVSISELLDDPNGLGNRPKNLLAYVDLGPELIYRTKHNVYSIPNHRPQTGFTDTLKIFGAIDDDSAKEVAKRRNVELILIRPDSKEVQLYRRGDELEILYERLVAGKTPYWLTEVSLPQQLAESFRLYEVNSDVRD